MNNTNNSSNSKDYDEYVRSKIWRPLTIDNNDDLGAYDVIELDQIIRALLLLLETNKL